MSTRVAIYARVHEIRDTPVALGRLAVAANMLKIIGLVALSIPDSEAELNDCLSHASALMPARIAPRVHFFFSFAGPLRRAIVAVEIHSRRWRAKVQRSSQSGNSIYRVCFVPIHSPGTFRSSSPFVILLYPSLNPHYSNEH